MASSSESGCACPVGYGPATQGMREPGDAASVLPRRLEFTLKRGD
jgi:hypothetical protein